ncbi:MAG: site-specific DNA-methyltransferase, partial [Betaproteobacteria bacterium AqS2]|nr:site-specific DNA-methyltransferase [Betaproteobacteria bacterium AqS2]
MGQQVQRRGRRDAAGEPFRSRLVHGDALRVLRALPADVSFDEVIADPPYNIGKDFGVVKDRLPLGRYLEWT